MDETKRPKMEVDDADHVLSSNGGEILGPMNCEDFLKTKDDGFEEIIAAVVMLIGTNDDSRFPIYSIDQPPFNNLPRGYKMRIKSNHYDDEIVRRSRTYFCAPKARPAQWVIKKKLSYLQDYPIPPVEGKSDLLFLQGHMQKLVQKTNHMIEHYEAQNPRPASESSRWHDSVPWLRLFTCFTVENIKDAFDSCIFPLLGKDDEIDSTTRDNEQNKWIHLVVAQFNDSSWIPTTEVVCDLHGEFARPIRLPYTVMLDPKGVRERMTKACSFLARMIDMWEQSGNGRFMLLPDDDPEKLEEYEVYEFENGDDRSLFVKYAQNRVYILYWWHIAYKNKILESARGGFSIRIKDDMSAESSVAAAVNNNNSNTPITTTNSIINNNTPKGYSTARKRPRSPSTSFLPGTSCIPGGKTWTVYLTGEIYSDWREVIAKGVKERNLPVILTSPNTNQENSNDCGAIILGMQEERPNWDMLGAKMNNIRTQTLLKQADVVVVRFGKKNRQWNAAFEAGIATALGKPLITLHPPSLRHVLKEVNASANVVCEEPEQVVETLAYVIRGELPSPRDGHAFISMDERLEK